ncbi:hypothetical protein TSOC_011358 [Tetrabaena socialis]|uniref:Uncharacterized protein n=1 Tax=Tetrabaena socialis TaxID=47790 RepID=A0A2J7ZQU7_9CHLO|nr:hypothetical protein TSOC_011358 [Tetrabaena socialis]|eukprot:PNH02644.1 hypothetical protein TSOC_011358 [Tetrabaena socialis]
MFSEAGVLDLRVDDAPRHLQSQLSEMGFSVVAAVRPPGLPGSAYIIPNGASFYSSSEDMVAIASFVNGGGLAVMLDAEDGEGAAQRSLIAKAMGFQGGWSLCKSLGSNSHYSYGHPALDTQARSFLPDAVWPAELEDVRVTSVHSRCLHEDASAVSWPLYTVLDDPDMVVAQAFSRVGAPGAVVWLGYSWKDGPQAEWGAMLRTLIEAFGTGGHANTPRSPSESPLGTTMRVP